MPISNFNNEINSLKINISELITNISKLKQNINPNPIPEDIQFLLRQARATRYKIDQMPKLTTISDEEIIHILDNLSRTVSDIRYEDCNDTFNPINTEKKDFQIR